MARIYKTDIPEWVKFWVRRNAAGIEQAALEVDVDTLAEEAQNLLARYTSQARAVLTVVRAIQALRKEQAFELWNLIGNIAMHNRNDPGATSNRSQTLPVNPPPGSSFRYHPLF